MKKIAIHIDENETVILLKYSDVDESKKESFLRGTECYKYINKLSKNKIVDIYEDRNGKDITLEYETYIVELNNYSKLLSKRGLSPILDNIRIYNEKPVLNTKPVRKVRRKNKYRKVRIMAGGLSLLVLVGIAAGMLHKNKKTNDEIEYYSLEEFEDDYVEPIIDIEDEIVITNLSTEKEIVDEKVIPTVSINYEDRSDTDKAYMTKARYSELISKYSKMYGLDSKLVTAIATQERGIHSSVKDEGGATGLMQVQNAVWAGERLSAYNFETNEMETIVVNEASLSDVHYNVKVGCMILQTVFKYMNYNTLAAVQCYNMGKGHMDTILNAYSNDSGKSVDDILNEITDTNWMDYRNLIKKGDPEYIEEVFSWLGNDVELTIKKDNGNEVCFNINQFEKTSKTH